MSNGSAVSTQTQTREIQTVSVPGHDSVSGFTEYQFIPKSATSQTVLKTKARKQHDLNKLRIPPQAMKMSTVSMSAKQRPIISDPLQHAASYVMQNNAKKVITWDQAHNSRPPLRVDMDGPGPCSYSIPSRPQRETKAPSYTFGRRTFVEKLGGARTSWEKTWFQNSHAWHQKTDFHSDRKWPAPPSYKQESSLGPKQKRRTSFPAYSIGVRRQIVLKEKRDTEDDPSPDEYKSEPARVYVLPKAPSFSHGLRRGGTVLWANTECQNTPGPGSYRSGVQAVKQHGPAFSIQGIRRDKTHELGPFATL
ncbi:hypothetical protein CAPTEDRAFT_215055 [Capitella teleta]|uniref:Uncharacterized protein n=1 Tax=Capitella teleta TaxID=283909 RepID=R7UQ54_CAPTE|nr:hypothetical protein CAPTEDRAFT_215055 [Capitella teleta]|eukprot:ELU08649.1 hypothetical protein CAPTEDRAFT_215055 [Capitella teleta]